MTVSFGLGSRLLNQCRKPAGWLGRLNLWRMDRHHSELTNWGLKHALIGAGDTILDVGCGGGRAITKMAAIASEGRIYGIDYSEESVAAARRNNKHAIRAGRVEIRHGSVSKLPFADNTFDVVTAIETHYYWPDLPADVREVFRVLKCDGIFILIAESYKGGKYDALLQRLTEVKQFMNYAHLSVGDHRDLFTNAGYSDVQVAEQYEKGWICAVGRKPDARSLEY